MGNSLTSSPCGQSKQQILEASFNKFNLPPDILTSKNSLSLPKEGNVITVYGEQNIKGTLFKTKNFFNLVDSKTEIDEYYQRYESKQVNLFPIAKIQGVKTMQQNNFCSSWKWYYVITQKLITFDQINDELSFQECVYVLFESLMGFFYLYAKHSNFNITDKMIGVNKEGKVKVWLNQNFAENHPENQLMQVYITKSIKKEDRETQKERRLIFERQMIKEIFDILNVKYKGTPNSFVVSLRNKIRAHIDNFQIRPHGFEELLEALSMYEQKSAYQTFIPNRLMLEREYVSRLPVRESFSQRLQRAIAQYELEMSMQEKQELRSYTTGLSGNTIRKYQEVQRIEKDIQEPHVSFNYQSEYKFTGYQSPYNFTQFGRGVFVEDAESEMIGVKKSEYSDRLQQFNYRSPTTKINIITYLPGDYENQIQTLSKDMRETYYQSSGGSRSNLIKSRSHTHQEHSVNSNSQSHYKFSNPYENQYTYTPQAPTNRYQVNLMQINEEIEAREESVRPSLISINVEGRSFMDRHSRNVSFQLKESKPIQERIFPPIIESRFTEDKMESFNSPFYVQKPFRLASSSSSAHTKIAQTKTEFQ